VQPYKHQGKERLRITGISLHNHGARNADNVMIRWLTRDPLEELDYWNNAYCLFRNNGVKYVDRDGRDARVTGSGTKEDPYVITAAYYYQNGSLSTEQIEGLNAAINDYNNSGGKNGVTVKNADGTKGYVKYNLSAEGVDNLGEALDNTSFTTTSGEKAYYGNSVGTNSVENGSKEYGSASAHRIDFNPTNIDAGVKSGLNSRDLHKGTAIHEIGHNLGGKSDHSDGTSVMDIIPNTTIINNQIGETTMRISHPSMSSRFTKIIFNRRDMPNPEDSGEGRIWTAKP
jgi:RHS repeat-associated protein